MSIETTMIGVEKLQAIILLLQNKDKELQYYKQQCADFQDNKSDVLARGTTKHSSSLKTDKNQLIRARSDPECLRNDDPRQTSNPEVFLFPDVKSKNKVTRESSLEIDGDSGSQSLNQQSQLPVSHTSLRTNENEAAVSMTMAERRASLPTCVQSGMTGVSEVYFNNLINEMVRTKRHLHNLQVQQKISNEDQQEMGKMTRELHQLRFTTQHLQRENARLLEQHAHSRPVKSDSVEFECAESKKVMKSTQTEPVLQDRNISEASKQIKMLSDHVEHLKEQNQGLMKEVELSRQSSQVALYDMVVKENTDMKAELTDLNDSYNVLKNSVKILSTCLQEEKKRKQQSDSLLNKQSEQFGNLRQQFEELRIEKQALEKSVHLPSVSSLQTSRSDSSFYTGPHYPQSTRSRSGDRSVYIQPSAGYQHNFSSGESVVVDSLKNRSRQSSGNQQNLPFSSGDPGRESHILSGGNVSGTGYTSSGQGSSHSRQSSGGPPMHWNILHDQSSGSPYMSQQNDLSSNTSSGDRAPSNISLPRYRPVEDPQITFECPRCLQTFQVENSYQIHLQKCIE